LADNLFLKKEMNDIFGKISDWKFNSSVFAPFSVENEKDKSEEEITFTSEFQGKITFKGETKNAKLFKGVLEGTNLIFVGEFDGLTFICGKRKIKSDDVITEELGHFENNYLVFGTMITSFEDCQISFTGLFKKNYLVYGEKKIIGMDFYESGRFEEGKLVYGYENENKIISSLSSPHCGEGGGECGGKSDGKGLKDINEKKDLNPFVFNPPLNDDEKEEIVEIEENKEIDEVIEKKEVIENNKKKITLMPAYFIDKNGELHLISFKHCKKIKGDGFNDKNYYIGAKLRSEQLFEKGIFENDILIKGISVNEKGEKKIIV
jgi:hypothetical protein